MDSKNRSGAEAEFPTPSVNVHAAKSLLVLGHRYVDVRTEEEFKKGHVENSVNIPYMYNTPEGRVKNPEFMGRMMRECGKEEPVVIGCQSGVRSVYATKDLVNAEYKHVYNMEGGYLAWVKNGFHVEKPEVEA